MFDAHLPCSADAKCCICLLPVAAQSDPAEFRRRWDAARVALTFNPNGSVTYFQQMAR